MMHLKHAARMALVAICLTGMSALAASEPPKSGNVNKVPRQSKPSPSGVALPVYKPPVGRGVPGGRVGGGTRGIEATFALSVLAPNHTGLTQQDQPVLYWYLSQPVSGPLEFALTDDGVKPLVEARLPPPFEPGIHGVRLEDYGIKLFPGKRYRWFVALVVDAERRSRDILAGGTIERVETTEGLATTIAHAGPSQVPFVYAEAGLWYDAVEAISTLIQASPNDPTLRKQRASLLEQGGLAEIANYDLTPLHAD